MPNDSYDFLGGEKLPYFPTKASKFGDSITGTICAPEPFQQQQAEPNGKLKTWDDGNPMLQLVVTVQTTMHDPSIEDDDGRRRFYVKGAMRNAIADAVRKAGAKGLDIGGIVTLVYTHDEPPSSPGMSPARQFTATYQPPSASADFLGTGNGAVAAPAALPAGMTPEVWATLPQAARDAISATATPPAAQINLPPGMTPDVWATLTPEAQAALSALVGK